MKIFSPLLCIAITSLPFLSCNKKSDPATPTTKTDQLTLSSWTYENAGIDLDRNGSIDQPLSTLAPALVQPCVTDNRLTFKRDNAGTVDEGPTKCNALDAQTSVFNWSFADNETNLTISNNPFPLLNGKSRIVNLTATNFTLSRDTVVFSSTVALIVSLKH